MKKINVFWFRNDLRLDDNIGLYEAINSDLPVLPIYIKDKNNTLIFNNDNVSKFIYYHIIEISRTLKNKAKSSIAFFEDTPENAFKTILKTYKINSVYANYEYEPYSINRDRTISTFLQKQNIDFHLFKDKLIFHKDDILNSSNLPYNVFSSYKKKWLKNLNKSEINIPILSEELYKNFCKNISIGKSYDYIASKASCKFIKPYNIKNIKDYDKTRDYPAKDGGTYLGPYLRLGIIGIRSLIDKTCNLNQTFISELIWREFFFQILYHYPNVIESNFKSKYNNIQWRNNEAEFELWCKGETGYPIVDAGMNELNNTGYMHNRVRMITASFLVKHLLIDWTWGETYFASKLNDFEQASNNGNWQWVAGTGCDATPYFRIFNPYSQEKKFDNNFAYIKKHIKGFEYKSYIKPIVEHKFARERALKTYKESL